eukprot:TRINITY_DN5875_c0_g1_i1.p1 TRINITY_DN5875_c0_g1~~TRINITY_DN5875_c0_g1_i1.p1  ORF type:complete len:394 (+),score=62.76 TRINITY_DN5875_c0_g1_i1:341-1522(+)
MSLDQADGLLLSATRFVQERLIANPADGLWAGAVVGAIVLIIPSLARRWRHVEITNMPRLWSHWGGGLSGKELGNKWKEYDGSYQANTEEEGIAEKSMAPQLADTFYNLVTDIYEWGYGQSFNLHPFIPGKGHKDAARIFEEGLADHLKLKPGMKVLDVGCGIGGPMRNIARYTQANVVGITINQYQIDRANALNKKSKLDHLCSLVQGDFLNMPFEDATFDAAYSIQATCHAPTLKDVYGQIFRVLKPGGLFVSSEWVTTPKYDRNNKDHVRIVNSICYSNALPEAHSYLEAEEDAKAVGFEVLVNKDLELYAENPWWTRIKMSRFTYVRNSILVSVFSALRIAPAEMKDVHRVLMEAIDSLIAGGELAIYTPIQLIVLRKPLTSHAVAVES